MSDLAGVQARHIKRGTTYDVLGEATIQTNAPLADMDRVVVYRCRETGGLWARRHAEFVDGRFEIDVAGGREASDLIRRLRGADEYEPLGHDAWEAADAIERLTGERDVYAQLSHSRGQLLLSEQARAEAAEDNARLMNEAASRYLRRAEAAEARLDARVTELLEANNRLLERARDAEALLREARGYVRGYRDNAEFAHDAEDAEEFLARINRRVP